MAWEKREDRRGIGRGHGWQRMGKGRGHRRELGEADRRDIGWGIGVHSHHVIKIRA